jgi:hypothetical protein
MRVPPRDDYLDTLVRVERFERARRRVYVLGGLAAGAFVVGVLLAAVGG